MIEYEDESFQYVWLGAQIYIQTHSFAIPALDKEDFTQEVFAKLWRSRGNIKSEKDPGELINYGKYLAKNQIIDLERKWGKRKFVDICKIVGSDEKNLTYDVEFMEDYDVDQVMQECLSYLKKKNKFWYYTMRAFIIAKGDIRHAANIVRMNYSKFRRVMYEIGEDFYIQKFFSKLLAKE
jgi:hypothetical protein